LSPRRTPCRLFGLLVATVAASLACPRAPAQIQRPDPDDVVTFAGFVDPVDLTTLVDFVSRTLGINIFLADPNMQGAQVQFRAPMDVRAGDLLDMLELLLEARGYALTQEREDWYVVRPRDALAPNFEDQPFATTQIFPTPLLKPSSLQSVISNVLPQNAQPRIVYSDALGVIISTAPARVNQAIGQALERIRQQLAAQEFHRIELTHIAATEARQRLLSLLGLAPQPSGAPAVPRAQQPAQTATAAIAGAGSFSNLPERLLLDRRGNALIFRGSAEELERVRSLVNAIDSPSALVVRRYNAGPLAFEIAHYGARMGLGPVRTSLEEVSQDAGGSLFLVAGGEGAEVFTYFGSEAQHRRVQELVDEFAAQAQDERVVVEFYKLENISVEDAAGLLTELLSPEGARREDGERARSPFLPPSIENTRGLRRVSDLGQGAPDRVEAARRAAAQQQAQQQAQQGGAASQASQAGAATASGETASGGGEEGQATLTPSENIQITPDTANNQLIVRAPVKQQREIARIIERIDQRRPQVLLDVQIISVSVSDSFSLNIDTALNPGLEQVFQGLSDLAEASFIGGSTSVIIDADQTPFVINAIASASESRVVSQPGVLVADNETATVSSTTDISFAQTTQVAGAPSQTSVGGTLSAGTNITVTPSVSEGGFMRLEINVELSSFGSSSSGGQNLPPDRNTNSFESVVTVPGDSTVVVGGLVSEQTQDTETKVPLLGDIPLIGEAFKNQSKSTSRNVIYVFITPRVLRDPTFADLRLLTRGPAAELGVETELPALKPARMPILGAQERP